jgi:hypothetical protein
VSFLRLGNARAVNFLCHHDEASNASGRKDVGHLCVLCHPDDLSNARGGTDLGQLRVSEAGSGFEIAQRSLSDLFSAQ